METSVISLRQSAVAAPTVRILIVEDERLVAMSLRKQLHSLGYEVVQSVSSGEAAIKAAVELQPDLILMDIRLEGGLDGIETATEIRKRHDLPIIYLTAFSNSDIQPAQRLPSPLATFSNPSTSASCTSSSRRRYSSTAWRPNGPPCTSRSAPAARAIVLAGDAGRRNRPRNQ